MRRVALVIGHREHSPGAINSRSGVSEYSYNTILAWKIIDYLKLKKVVGTELIFRRSYDRLPHDINKLKCDFIVSLHANAFNKKVSGSEVLYYYRSVLGHTLAEILQSSILPVLKLKDRGTRPKGSEDRGGYVLRYTWAPMVILEPFFIDNDEDFAVATEHRDELGRAIAHGIEAFAEVLDNDQ